MTQPGADQIPAIVARLQRKRLIAWARIAGMTAAAALLLWLLVAVADADPGFAVTTGLLVIAAWIFAAFIAVGRYSQHLEAQLMPVIARATGDFSHRRSLAVPRPVRDLGLFPRTLRLDASDRISGTLGDSPFAFWRAHVYRIGAETTDIFRGVVIETGVPRGGVLAVLPACDTEAAGPEGLHRLDRVVLAGHRFDIWTSPEARADDGPRQELVAFVEGLDPNTRFHGLVEADGQAFIAIHDGKGPARLGSLFTGKAETLRMVSAAFDMFVLPATLALSWPPPMGAVPSPAGASSRPEASAVAR